MKKILFYTISCIIMLCSCNNNENLPAEIQTDTIKSETSDDCKLKGTWARYTESGLSLIEIIDSSNVIYTAISKFEDAEKNIGYHRYTSKGTFGYFDENFIWILTDKYRIDYIVSNDTLFEWDKMGMQGKYVKTHTAEEQAFKLFNETLLRGKLTHFCKVHNTDFFVLDMPLSMQYSFISNLSTADNQPNFSDIVALGDSIFKPAYGDTLFVYKKVTQACHKFTFKKP